jgi:threonine/homoserine/homoserine lactone efflux protein
MDGLPAFVVVAALIAVSPGPDLVLVTRGVLAGGRPGGLLTAFGIASGSAVWALASAVGLAAVLAASPDALGVVRWAGAGYLGWIGVRAIAQPQAREGGEPQQPVPASRAHFYRVGLVSNVLHPGQVVFYTSMVPQFIDTGSELTLQVLMLGAIFVAVVLTWFSAYALVAGGMPVSRWDRLAPMLSRLSGLVLIALAVRLVVLR